MVNFFINEGMADESGKRIRGTVLFYMSKYQLI